MRKVFLIGDTYEQHKELDYSPFLEIQLEIIDRIIETERRISKLKSERAKDFRKIEEAKERRHLLKLIGTTVAWILLEFDRAYIRNLARGGDPGFISGKEGLKLERLALKQTFSIKNHAAILHDITNCLRTGDLSVVGPEGIHPLELKLRKEKGKLDRRERRQKRKGGIILEFYRKGISSKIIPGMTSVAHSTERPDKHNWKESSAAIQEAVKNGHGIRIVEECLIYIAFKDELPNELFSRYDKLFKDPYFITGCHDKHIKGLPSIMPFTCFELPLKHKEKLLFREINFCVMLDIKSLCRILEKNGFQCKRLKDSDKGILEIYNVGKGKLGPLIVGYGMTERLLYECLSVKTLLDYIKEMLERISKGEISTEIIS